MPENQWFKQVYDYTKQKENFVFEPGARLIIVFEPGARLIKEHWKWVKLQIFKPKTQTFE